MTFATDQKPDDAGLSATSKAMLAMRSEVFDDWEALLRQHVDGAQDVAGPILINTLPAFYDNIAEASTPSYPRADGTSGTTSMSAHGGERARMTPFRADQVIHEYQFFMLTELVDALTFERGVELPLALTEFDMQDLVNAIGGEFEVVGAGKVETDSDSIVGFWCRNSLHRAIENLVVNAFKYGNGEPVRVKADSIRGRLMLSVHNSGSPIAADQRETIFGYLKRESGGSMIEGWGIGLPFVRSVAESHGGSVALDNSAEGGTTFVIDIPVDCRPYVQTPQ